MLRSRRSKFGSQFNEVMRDSVEKVKDIGDALQRQMPETTERVTGQCPEPAPVIPQPERNEIPPDHIDLGSEHDYDSPYGVSERDNYHAVCVDETGKLVFLSHDTKSGLTQKINQHPNLDDVIAVYGGNLIYFEERRIIHIG